MSLAKTILLYEKIQTTKLSGSNFKLINSVFSKNTSIKQNDGIQFISPNEVSYLTFNRSAFKNIDKAITIVLPTQNYDIELELLDVSDTFNNYEVITNDGKKISANKNIKHFRGIIKNDPNSVVSMTFLEDEVIGLITTGKENYNISYDRQSGNHVLFKDTNQKNLQKFNCGTMDDYSFDYDSTILSPKGLNSTTDLSSKVVSFYFETEHDIFLTRGSVSSVEGYITGIYNQVATLYQREGIQTRISEIFVWTTEDPFTATNTAGLLAQFQNTRTSINASLGHLLTFRDIGGGMAAGFQGLCTQNTSQKLAVSMIYTTYQFVANYSWTVFVITHEFGHFHQYK